MTASLFRPTSFGVAEELRNRARESERQARYYRSLAKKVENPPKGVRVEFDLARGIVRFVGPPVSVQRG